MTSDRRISAQEIFKKKVFNSESSYLGNKYLYILYFMFLFFGEGSEFRFHDCSIAKARAESSKKVAQDAGCVICIANL